MTKGYSGVKGEIMEPVKSRLEFYLVRLENGLHPVVGPSAFRVAEDRGPARKGRRVPDA